MAAARFLVALHAQFAAIRNRKATGLATVHVQWRENRRRHSLSFWGGVTLRFRMPRQGCCSFRLGRLTGLKYLLVSALGRQQEIESGVHHFREPRDGQDLFTRKTSAGYGNLEKSHDFLLPNDGNRRFRQLTSRSVGRNGRRLGCCKAIGDRCVVGLRRFGGLGGTSCRGAVHKLAISL